MLIKRHLSSDSFYIYFKFIILQLNNVYSYVFLIRSAARLESKTFINHPCKSQSKQKIISRDQDLLLDDITIGLKSNTLLTLVIRTFVTDK